MCCLLIFPVLHIRDVLCIKRADHSEFGETSDPEKRGYAYSSCSNASDFDRMLDVISSRSVPVVPCPSTGFYRITQSIRRIRYTMQSDSCSFRSDRRTKTNVSCVCSCCSHDTQLLPCVMCVHAVALVKRANRGMKRNDSMCHFRPRAPVWQSTDV
jgi:hypothetical protein